MKETNKKSVSFTIPLIAMLGCLFTIFGVILYPSLKGELSIAFFFLISLIATFLITVIILDGSQKHQYHYATSGPFLGLVMSSVFIYLFALLFIPGVNEYKYVIRDEDNNKVWVLEEEPVTIRYGESYFDVKFSGVYKDPYTGVRRLKFIVNGEKFRLLQKEGKVIKLGKKKLFMGIKEKIPVNMKYRERTAIQLEFKKVEIQTQE